MGGKQSGVYVAVPLPTMIRKRLGNSSTSPSTSTNVKPKNSPMKPPPFLPNRPSEVAERSQPVTLDLPSKLIGLPFDSYKRAERTSPVARGKVPIDGRRVPSGMSQPSMSIQILNLNEASQITRHPSTSKTKPIPPDVEIIEVSEDDSPSLSISKTESKSKSKSSQAQSPTARTESVPGTVTETVLPRAEVIEIFDSDDEQLPSKAQEKGSSGSQSSELVQECATGSSPRQPPSFESSDRDADGMDVDEAYSQPASLSAVGSDSEIYPGDLFDIPSSSRVSSQELEVTDDNDSQAARGLISLPSSSPSSIGLNPGDRYLSTPPAPTTSVTSLTLSPPPQQPSTSTMNTASTSNRLGFTSVAASSSLQAPPPAKKHVKRCARKSGAWPDRDEDTEEGSSDTSVAASSSLQAPPPANTRVKECARKSASGRRVIPAGKAIPLLMSDRDEDIEEDSSEPPEGKKAAKIKGNKGKGKEIRQTLLSTSGSDMRGFRDGFAMDSDKLKQKSILPTWPKKEKQTLAEAIISAGQLNRMKTKAGRRPQGNTKDVPIDLTSDIEGGVSMADEKTLKAAIGSSRKLVDLLKGKSSINVTAKGKYLILVSR